MVWGFCVYFVFMIPLETDVLRKHRFQKAPVTVRLHNCVGFVGQTMNKNANCMAEP